MPAHWLGRRWLISTCHSSHILAAAQRLDTLDEKQINAVGARIELDLRIGYAFTRFMTNNLRTLGGPLKELVLSYGTSTRGLGMVEDGTNH